MKRKKRVFTMATVRISLHFWGVRRLLSVGLLGACFLAEGCLSPEAGHKLSWRTLSRGLTSGLTEPRRDVVRSEVEFLKLWAEHAADVNRPALPPSVDFEREMVVVVAMGTRPTGGYLTEVVDVELRGGGLKILVGERMPSEGTLQVQRPTQPFQFIALPAIQGRVRFRLVRESGRSGLERKARPGEEGSGPRPVKPPVKPATSPRGAASGA